MLTTVYNRPPHQQSMCGVGVPVSLSFMSPTLQCSSVPLQHLTLAWILSKVETSFQVLEFFWEYFDSLFCRSISEE